MFVYSFISSFQKKILEINTVISHKPLQNVQFTNNHGEFPQGVNSYVFKIISISLEGFLSRQHICTLLPSIPFYFLFYIFDFYSIFNFGVILHKVTVYSTGECASCINVVISFIYHPFSSWHSVTYFLLTDFDIEIITEAHRVKLYEDVAKKISIKVLCVKQRKQLSSQLSMVWAW